MRSGVIFDSSGAAAIARARSRFGLAGPLTSQPSCSLSMDWDRAAAGSLTESIQHVYCSRWYIEESSFAIDKYTYPAHSEGRAICGLRNTMECAGGSQDNILATDNRGTT